MRVADYGIIGAGIVGLAIARQLLTDDPACKVVLFDKESRLAEHASGRNSGVLHAGFYYAPDSIKARMTRRGNILLHEFCAEHSVPVIDCGKVVVARNEFDLLRMDALLERAVGNGVPLEPIDEVQLREIEPLARTFERALWSPTTGVADPSAVVHALAADVVGRGGRVQLAEPVLTATDGQIRTSCGQWSVRHVINAAGLYADHFARNFGMCDDYVVLPFKGIYRYGAWAPGRLRRHVYPVPDPRNPFLGVHVTVTASGEAKIGPTAIPVLWREQYGGMERIQLHEIGGTIQALIRFLRSDMHESKQLVRGELRKYSHRVLAHEAAELVPPIRPEAFKTKGRPGIRAQLAHKETGSLEMDFVVRGDRHSTHVLNAVSPAWTSALSFAEHVADDIHTRGA